MKYPQSFGLCVVSAFVLGFVFSRMFLPNTVAEKVYEIKIVSDPYMQSPANALWGAESTDPVWVFTFQDKNTAVTVRDKTLLLLSNQTDRILGIIP